MFIRFTFQSFKIGRFLFFFVHVEIQTVYNGNGARLGMYARLYARTYRHTCTPFGTCFFVTGNLPLYIFRYIALFPIFVNY